MALRIAINGFGRIGRSLFRLWLQQIASLQSEAGRGEIEIVALNDVGFNQSSVNSCCLSFFNLEFVGCKVQNWRHIMLTLKHYLDNPLDFAGYMLPDTCGVHWPH